MAHLHLVVSANAPAFIPRVLFASRSDAYNPSISSDGTKALFLTADSNGNEQAFVINLDGSGLSQVSRESLGINDGLLSPDGRSVIAVGGDGSLLRFSLGDGARSQIIGPTLSLTPEHLNNATIGSPSLTASPGQVVHLTGTQLSGATVQVSGFKAPVINSNSSTLDFQVPWEIPTGHVSIPVGGMPFTVSPTGATSGWQGALGTLNVSAINPSWTIAIHQNFEGLISTSNPAKPGEIINLYASGFGPVINPPADGQPAPSAPLSPLVTPLSLVVSSSTGAIVPQVFFAGLAPGTIGAYQISTQLPASLTSGVYSLQAQFEQLTISINIAVSQ